MEAVSQVGGSDHEDSGEAVLEMSQFVRLRGGKGCTDLVVCLEKYYDGTETRG